MKAPPISTPKQHAEGMGGSQDTHYRKRCKKRVMTLVRIHLYIQNFKPRLCRYICVLCIIEKLSSLIVFSSAHYWWWVWTVATATHNYPQPGGGAGAGAGQELGRSWVPAPFVSCCQWAVSGGAMWSPAAPTLPSDNYKKLVLIKLTNTPTVNV